MLEQGSDPEANGGGRPYGVCGSGIAERTSGVAFEEFI